MENNELYDIVIAEIKDGIYDEELWQKALNDNNNDLRAAEQEYIELRAAQLKQGNFNQQQMPQVEDREEFRPSRKPVKKRNIIIGITLLFLLIVLLVFLGNLLHEYFSPQ